MAHVCVMVSLTPRVARTYFTVSLAKSRPTVLDLVKLSWPKLGQRNSRFGLCLEAVRQEA